MTSVEESAMERQRHRMRPVLESLDTRIFLATVPTGTTAGIFPASLKLIPGSFPSANRFRSFTPADLQAYAEAYLAFSINPNYNAAYDFNGTGFIGQNDATPILRGLAGITPHGPLSVNLNLAPGQQIYTRHPSVNGAATRLGTVTVVGQTEPNSVIFYDSFANSRLGASGNFKFEGGAVIADARGRFTHTLTLTPLSKNSLTTFTILIRTPHNQQTIRAFPIFRIG